jgi:hypothetical protein
MPCHAMPEARQWQGMARHGKAWQGMADATDAKAIWQSLLPIVDDRREPASFPLCVPIKVKPIATGDNFSMAVPKKRTSKTKKNIRKASWKRKAAKASDKAYSLAVVALRREEEKDRTKKAADASK